MSTPATPLPATPSTPAPTPAKSATAGVNLSTTTIGTSLLQIILGAAIAAASILFSILAPSESHIILAVLGGLGGALIVLASVWHLLHLNSTSSSNTLTALEGLL